jgi:GTPase
VNKEKLAQIKSKIKECAPQIILTLTTVASVVYAVSVKKALAEEAKRFPKTDATYLMIGDETMERLNNGDQPYWMVEGHKIGLRYDPDR